jgi:hypothetical protein
MRPLRLQKIKRPRWQPITLTPEIFRGPTGRGKHEDYTSWIRRNCKGLGNAYASHSAMFTDVDIINKRVTTPISYKGENFMLSPRIIKHRAMMTNTGVEVYLHTFLASAPDGGEWLPTTPTPRHPDRFIPGERARDTFCIEC